MLRQSHILKWQETDEVNHLSKFSKIHNTILNFLQAITNGISLVDDFEKRVAHRGLKEKIVGHGEYVEPRQSKTTTTLDKDYSLPEDSFDWLRQMNDEIDVAGLNDKKI